MTDALDLFRTETVPVGACYRCSRFAAGKRDRHGFLMKTLRGYCDWHGHPGGPWNVEQNIVKHQRCAGFSPAEPGIVKSRADWLLKHTEITEEDL